MAEIDLRQAKADALEARAGEIEVDVEKRRAKLSLLLRAVTDFEGSRSIMVTSDGQTQEMAPHAEAMRGAAQMLSERGTCPIDVTTGRRFDADL